MNQFSFEIKCIYFNIALHNTMTLIVFSVVVLSLSTLANGECVVKDDPENIVSTQLEGSWGLNVELSLILSPWSDGLNIKELK